MTEPSTTDYVPIACDLHSEYELAILHRQPLHLVWTDGNVIHDEIVLPLDLTTERHHDDPRDGGGRAASGDGRDAGGRATPGAVAGTAAEEFLLCRSKDGSTHHIRLDHVRRMKAA